MTVRLEFSNTNSFKMYQPEDLTYEQEENLLVQSAIQKKDERLQSERQKEKEFRIRSGIVQDYFMRMSCGNKKKFIIRLLNSIDSLEAVLRIINFMSIGHAKAVVYSIVSPQTNFLYDKLLVDHDRMLDKKTLDQTIEEDIEWFIYLDAQNQVTLLTELLRSCGGNVKKTLYMPFLRKYFDTVQRLNFGLVKSNVQLCSKPLLIAPKNNEQYDPRHPATIEVEKQRKKWGEIINKYRMEVDDAAEKLTMSKLKKESKAKIDKKSKSKSKKESKTKKPKKDEIDWIQLMPVWIAKKILDYLDQKQLQSLKKVNSYWAYIIQDLLGNRKMRKQLDATLNKMKSDIDPLMLEEAVKVSIRPKITSVVGKNVYLGQDRGAIIEEMVPKPKKTEEKSLIADIQQTMINDDFVGQILSFPRVIKDEILYRQRPCFLKDVNVKLGIEEDRETLSNFLTYSLSNKSSELDINISEKTLTEW